MVELCIPKNRMFFCFSILLFFCWENDVTRLTAKLKFQDMAKQLSNLKRARHDRVKCEKKNLKSSFGLIVLSSHFLISCHFVPVFRNISTFQDAICAFPKIVSTFVSITSRPFKIQFPAKKR